MKLSRVAKSTLVLAVTAIVTGGMFAATASAARPPRPGPGGGCLCPDVYAPVLCPNGQTYSNGCVAGCNGQRNCTPIGDI